MTCASSPSCRIRRGQRHEASCPRRGVSSGPSGKALHPKSNVETRHTDTLRQLLGLLMDTAPNETTSCRDRQNCGVSKIVKKALRVSTARL